MANLVCVTKEAYREFHSEEVFGSVGLTREGIARKLGQGVQFHERRDHPGLIDTQQSILKVIREKMRESGSMLREIRVENKTGVVYALGTVAAVDDHPEPRKFHRGEVA